MMNCRRVPPPPPSSRKNKKCPRNGWRINHVRQTFHTMESSRAATFPWDLTHVRCIGRCKDPIGFVNNFKETKATFLRFSPSFFPVINSSKQGGKEELAISILRGSSAFKNYRCIERRINPSASIRLVRAHESACISSGPGARLSETRAITHLMLIMPIAGAIASSSYTINHIGSLYDR